MSKDDMVAEIAECLGVSRARAKRVVGEFDRVFAKPFAERLASVRLREILKRKNPYLYRASAIESCTELVDRAYDDYVSASVEGYFGKFFEAVAIIVSGGIKPAGGGEIDLQVMKGKRAYLYVIKSGPATFNKTSRAKAKEELFAAEHKLEQDGYDVKKMFGYAYGRKVGSNWQGITILSSKEFWSKVSGDADFYQKLLDACAILSSLYSADVEAPRARLLKEAGSEFCDDDKTDWPKILKLVSG